MSLLPNQPNIAHSSSYLSELCVKVACYRGPIFEKSYDELMQNLRKSLTYQELSRSM